MREAQQSLIVNLSELRFGFCSVLTLFNAFQTKKRRGTIEIQFFKTHGKDSQVLVYADRKTRTFGDNRISIDLRLRLWIFLVVFRPFFRFWPLN